MSASFLSMRVSAAYATAAIVALFTTGLRAQTPQFPNPVSISANNTLTITPNPNGDRIPDFSTVGWNYGNTPLPDAPGGYEVPVVVTLAPTSGDQTDRIQAAIDFIASRPLVNGFRGALLLKAGRWEIDSINRLAVRTSGVVIRGEGDHPPTGTRLYALGTINENGGSTLPRSPLLTFQGNSNSVNATARTLVDNVYVPSGTTVIPITGHTFTVGQRIQVRWPGSVAWQKASLFKTDATTDLDPAVTHNRVITAVTPNSITLDAPITTPLDPAWGRGYIVPVTALNNITNVGVSNIYFESAYANDTDETHAINAVYFHQVEDGFMHNCTARYFAFSAANISQNTRKITVDRCQYLDGISQLIGARRYSFLLSGELGLVSNSISRYGRHSFVSSWPGIPGPVVFVDSVATGSYNESGAHLDWNNGGLWDNITDNILQVKLERPAASSVAWNCILGTITFENMPFTPNWSFGTTNSSGGAPTWRNSLSTGSFAYAAPHIGKAEQWFSGTRMPVRSLYENQLNTRLAAARNPHRYAANPTVRIPYLPIIRTPDQLTVQSGSAWSYRLPVSNIVPSTRTPNYTVSGLPAGLSVNATTGLISGMLPVVASSTNFTLSISARNIDGTTTKPMTLTVRPAGLPKIPLSMRLEVDVNRTINIDVRGNGAADVPMVPSSRLLAPMIVRKSYISDANNVAYTATDVPVPVRGVLPIEGLTSPITITYNGSSDLPTAAGVYNVAATLEDPVYEASATGQLLITNASAVTVTLGNTTAPTAANPVTATSTQPSIAPVITYDGSPTFPTAPGQYAAKAVVANQDFFGSRLALISVGRANATLTLGNTTLSYTGNVGAPPVSTNPPGLPVRVSIHGQGILPGTYPITAWIDDPAYAYTPVSGNMTIQGLVISTPGNLTISGNATGAVVNFDVSAGDGFTSTANATATPPSGSFFPLGTTTVNVTATDTQGQVWSKAFTVTVFPGPSQLQQINPGAGVAPGTATINATASSVTIVGAGGTTAGGATADLWTGTNDSNTYLFMPWQGDGVFTARLASFSAPSDASAKAGLIFRETTNAGSRYSTIHLLRSGSVNFQHKTATGGATTNTNFFNGSAAGVGIPEWIRMRRQGDTFTLSYSGNGTTWTELSSRSNAMTGSTLSVGFVVAPRTGNTTATATFDNISFLALPAAPGGLSATPGVNSVALAWSAVTDAATYSVKRATAPGGPYTTLADNLTATSYTDSTASGGSPVYYVVTASNLVGEGPASAEVSATPLTALQGWRQQYFGTTANSGNAADTADPDGDSVRNLVEYALDTLPNSAASGANPTAQVVANRLQLTFLRARSDVTYLVEASNDLSTGSWQTLATNPGTVGQTVTVTDTVDLTTVPNQRRFLRLRVTAP